MPYIAAGVIAAIAILIFILLVGSSFSRIFIGESPKSNAESITKPEIELGVDNVNVNKTSENTAVMQVSFAVHNTGKSTAILQTVQYSILVNGIKIASGAIGRQSEDVISGQASVYPVLAGDTIHPKDIQSLNKSAVGSSVWDSITGGKVSYAVKGIYLFRDNTNLQAEGVVKDFELAYPPTTTAPAVTPNNQNNSSAGSSLPKLVQTIPLSNVNGRIDHMSVDLSGKRLFIAELGNNSLDVVDLKSGKRIGSISSGLSEPQGVVYISETNRIVVANGGDGSVKFYDGNSLSLLQDIKLASDADNIRYDNGTGLLYVGNGDGAIAVINDTTSAGKLVGEIKQDGHPESFQLEKSGTRIFVNVPSAQFVEVADKQKLQIDSRWSTVTSDASENFPMALDETNHRLFVGFRDPATVIVYDTETGKEIVGLPTAKDADDIFYDTANKQIYISAGEGFINIFKQVTADHYEPVAKIATAQGARTSLFVPELNRLYLVVPSLGPQQSAQIWVYEVQ